MRAKDVVSIAKQSFQEWIEDRAPNEAAALAYYTMLSVPALLLLIQWFLGQVVSDAVQQQVITFVQQAVRGAGRDAITALIKNADRPGSGGGVATIVSLATLALSATGVVTHLEQSLNRMWEIVDEQTGIKDKIRKRLSSFLLVIVLGIFLVLSVSVTTAVSALAGTLTARLPAGEWLLQIANAAVSLVLLTLLFGATLKIIPDAEVAWGDTWLGAVVTALLFLVGQYVLGLYLGKSAPGSAYGAAGSVVAFLVWVYYSTLILFLGAEFTQVYANRFGSHIAPDDSAVPLEEKVVREQAHPSREPADDDSVLTEGTLKRRPDVQPVRGRGYDVSAPSGEDPVTRGSVGDRQRRAAQSNFPYVVVGAVALAIGVWRWLRGGNAEASRT